MFMKNIILVLILINYFCGVFVSAHIIDENESKCIAETADTQIINRCSIIAQEAWENEINKNLSKLKLLLDNRSYNALINSQQKWLKYKNKENILISMLKISNRGTMYMNVEQGLKTDILKQRALKLQEYIDLFND